MTTDVRRYEYCAVCGRAHNHWMTCAGAARIAEMEPAPAAVTESELTAAILASPAADRGDPRIVAAAILAQFHVTHRAQR